MAERSSKRKKKDHDFAGKAFEVFKKAIGEAVEPEEAPERTTDERHNAAVLLGRKGGKKGGKANGGATKRDREEGGGS